MSKRAYKTYTKKFKVEAIRLAGQSDQPMTQVARKLGLRVNQIYKWEKQLEEKQGDAFSGKRTATDKDAEIQRLNKALAASQEENEFPKKNGRVLCQEPVMRYAAIHRCRRQYSVRMMCRAMGVSRSGYCDWVDRPASARAQRHRTLSEKIRYFHQTSRDTYGSPRICEDLLRAGEQFGKNTVALLMQGAGIVPKTVPAPNRLEREFVAKYPISAGRPILRSYRPDRAGYIWQ